MFRVALLVVLSLAPLAAADHVVSRADLAHELSSGARLRQERIAKLRDFFSTPQAQRAMSNARVDPQQVTAGVALLSDAELARLSQQAQQAQHDFAAGSLTHFQITLIIAGAILIALILAIAAL